VSVPLFSNPLSELDAALAGTSSSTYTPGNMEDRARRPTGKDPHPVLRLGVPPLAEQLPYLASPNPEPVFFGLSSTPAPEVARQAASLARNGTLFLVTYFAVRPDVLEKYDPNSPISQFLKALPPGFQIVEHVTYPGDIPEYVYVFRESR
jgi:hypothetical protein